MRGKCCQAEQNCAPKPSAIVDSALVPGQDSPSWRLVVRDLGAGRKVPAAVGLRRIGRVSMARERLLTIVAVDLLLPLRKKISIPLLVHMIGLVFLLLRIFRLFRMMIFMVVMLSSASLTQFV